jgi:hypothetical protein
MEDVAEEQEFSMPVWIFNDATAMVDGDEVNLRGFTLPAVEGFLPEVHIASPADGTRYLPGTGINLTAQITSGESPYTYTLELEDGTLLATGITEGGEITISSGDLPASERPDRGLFLRLEAVDSNGVPGEDTLVLLDPLSIFVPVINKTLLGSTLSLNYYAPALRPLSPELPQATRSMGVEWIRYYNGHGSNLPGTQPDGTGFDNKMIGHGYMGRFHWYNNDAWEKDWRDCTLGGIDCTSGVDRVDFAYFAGHGSPAKIYFGVAKDAYNASAANARFQNLRWAGFATCQTLRAGPYVGPGNPPLTQWFNSFRGSYMLLGFHSNMADVAFGPRLVDNMKPVTFLGLTLYQHSIREAWVTTAFQMNAGKPAYLYAVGSRNPVNDKLPSGSSTNTLAPLTGIYQYRWVWWD